MGKIKQFFSDMFALLFMGIGISTTRQKQKKLDLRKLVADARPGSVQRGDAEESWILINRSVSNAEYKNQQAVRFDSRAGKGIAWIDDLRFSVGKLDLTIAAVKQDVGVAFHVQSEREFEAICFHIENETRDESESQRVVVRYISTFLDRNANHEAQFDLPYGQSGEWFKTRTSITKDVINVFIGSDNVPILRIDTEDDKVYGSVGLWIGPGSSALVADFRIHEVRGDLEKQIRRISGNNTAQ